MGIEKKVKIRLAVSSDVKKLSVLKQQVWISTYAIEGITDEFSEYVLSEFSLDRVGNLISDKNRIILLASMDHFVVGCAEILLSSDCPVTLKGPSLEILTLYVLENFHGFGIGKKLLDKCLEEIKLLNFHNVWLTVYHKNDNAFGFYSNQNFNHIGNTYFELGADKHKNYVMEREIE